MKSLPRPFTAAFLFIVALFGWRVLAPEFSGSPSGCSLCELSAEEAVKTITAPATVPQSVADALASPQKTEIQAGRISLTGGGADSGAEPEPSRSLAAPLEEQWAQPVKESAFAAFKTWTAAWLTAEAAERPALEAEGIKRAATRRRAMADTMMSRPARALQLSVPESLRRQLPQSVTVLLETPVNAVAEYRVTCVLPPPDAREKPRRLLREAVIGGRVHQVFTAGAGLEFVTKAKAPVNGISLPADAGTNPPDHPLRAPEALLALDPAPARPLEAVELQTCFAAAAKPPVCPVTGETLTDPDRSAGFLLGGEVHVFHKNVPLNEQAAIRVKEAALTLPDGAAKLSETEGGVTAASGYTEGAKRYLFLRVRFTDGSYTIPMGTARTLMSDLVSYMAEMSYERLRIAPEGPEGSAITPELQLSQPVAAYNDAGLSRLYPDARAAAAALGYNLDDYDFAAVFTSSRPAANYAGLGYVGGVGVHIANGYFDKWVLAHELGHNLGLPHAHSLNNGGNSILGAGETEEYGDNYDPMGNGKENSHYAAGLKQYIDWIPAADVTRITTGGVYRVYAQDNIYGDRGLRTIRVARNGTQDYWFDFQEDHTDAQFQNGLIMRYANRDGRESYILDSKPRENTRTLSIGRTFSDPVARVHITPLNRAPTWPSSMDTAVYFNTPGNQEPRGNLTAHSLFTAVNVPVLFTMTAQDADGHDLAYAWDFGDGTFSMDNSASVSRSWSSAGEYVVQCTVSDMRGGTFRDSVIVTAGAPASPRRINGRVVDRQNQPLAGLRVYTDDSHYAWTDSDGSWTLTRLAVGDHEVKVLETVRNLLTFDAVEANPVTLSAAAPVRTGFDFTAADTSSGSRTELVPLTSNWKYHDLGQSLGTAWRAPAYDDSGWQEGPGLLGYGNDGEGTVLSYGGNSSLKHATAYFRKTFDVADPSAFNELRVLCRRDDGVVIFLNGTRILRDNFAANLADNSIVYSTLAAEAVEPDSDVIRTGIPATLLSSGKNVLAAEVHQVDRSSSDLAFDAQLTGVTNTPEAGARSAYLTWPGDGEVIPLSAALVTLTAEARARTTTVTKVEFYADGAKLGEDSAAPFGQSWLPAAGDHTFYTVTTFAGLPVPLTSGTVRCRVADAPAALVSAGAEWKWLGLQTAAQATPEGWREQSFNDTAWATGTAPLGYGDGDETTVLTGSPYAAALFRRAFDVPDPAAWTSLLAKLVRDDAAVIYLNGAEVWRSNFLTNSNGTQTPQSAGSAAAAESAWHTQPLNPALLRPGRNVIAVEVRQESANTTDLSFDLALEGTMENSRAAGVYLTAPASVTLPAAPVLQAEAAVANGVTAGGMTFLANGTVIGQDAEYPWEFSWSGASPGAHVLTAELRDAAGLLIAASAPVTVNVLPTPPGADLVSFNSQWKFLDSGADPGASWAATAFNDNAWPSGYGKFGYGGDGENTELTWTRAQAKPAAAFFRKKFTPPAGNEFQALRLRVQRDDGIAVFLNGAEILRENLPPGRLSFGTLAVTALEMPEETAVREFIIPVSALTPGENIIAAQVHQSAVNSDDLGFDLSLTGLAAAPAGTGLWLTQPASGERLNPGVPLPLGVFLTGAQPVQRVEYFAGAAKIGESSASPWSFTWTTPLNGSFSLKARAVLETGGALDSPPVAVSVGTPPAAAVLITARSNWRYWETAAPPAAWNGKSYDDTAWPQGPARLGFGNDGEQTVLPQGRITYYFRRAFEVPADAVVENPVLQIQRDDGAVVYLNGTRLGAVNIGATVTPATLATRAISGNDETAWVNIPVTAAQLHAGANVLAVEMHQSSATSSDIGFDARLTALISRTSGLINTSPSTVPVLTLRAAAGPQTGGLELHLPEADGRVYVLESSENLQSWSPVSTHIITGGAGLTLPVPPADPAAGSAFYRARWLANP